MVFIPNYIQYQLPGYLIGNFREERKIFIYIYILGTDTNQVESAIGTYSTQHGKVNTKSRYENFFWISLTFVNNEVCIDSCIINKTEHNLKDCLLIIYDINSLLQSELLLLPNYKKAIEIDHFKILASDLQIQKGIQIGYGFNFFSRIIEFTVLLFSIIHYILHKSCYVTKYSTLAVHLKNYCQTVLWIRNVYKETKFISLKVGNCLASVVFDMILGLLLFYFITRWKSGDQIFDSILSCTEVCNS